MYRKDKISYLFNILQKLIADLLNVTIMPINPLFLC